ncbi:MAG: cadherin repeat domain-containing protein, partial [Porticoccaceae bacterium]|nr:cadherin repeat domain-containing protein [Porticoccaceae bacterium]
DGDASTDTYVDFAWASLFGGWPGTGEHDLVTLTFDIADGATGSSGINFSTSSNAAGFDVDAPSHDVVIGAEAEPVSSQLSIDATTGAVSLATDPDYEAQSEYNFNVTATDAAGNESAARAVILEINNLDEVVPAITSGDVAAAIDENSGAAQVIYTATADDSGDISGGISFSLAADSDVALSIDAATGAVALAADPNYEAQDQYSFTVIATDAAGNASQQAVTLAVNNLDEGAPVITSSESASVDENNGAAQVIYTASSDDGEATYSLAEGSDAALSIDATTAEVSLAADPDYETQSQYSFTIIATDAVGNASQQAVTLAVNNLDEVAPTITSADGASVVENSGAGQIVYTATSDDSADISGGVSYDMVDTTAYSSAGSSSGSVESVISIPELVANTQHLYVSESTVSEDGTQATVVVSYNADDSTVTGLGLRVHYNSQTLSLNEVVDVLAADQIDGDATPAADVGDLDGDAITDTYVDFAWASLFGQWPSSVPADLATFTFDIAADATGSSPINFSTSSSAAGFDVDGQRHSLSITSESEDAALSIDENTGAVTLATDPNYETQDQYNFTVIATDAAGNASEQAVTLSVTDVDDTLVVTSGASVSVEENSGADQVIYTATADNNADANATVGFILAAGSDEALSIDSAAGKVSLTVDPDYEIQDQYSFTVIATDTAGNESAPQAVTLSVVNLDEVAPTIISSDTASIEENMGAGQVIYTANADDSADYSDGVTYGLSVDPVLHSQVGAIERRFVDNADGSITLTLQLLVDPSVVDDYPDGIENLDLSISYNPAEIGHIAGENISAPSSPFMAGLNAEASGEIIVSYVYFPSAFNLASETPILEVDFNFESGVTSAGFEISGVRVNEDDLTGTVLESRYLGDGALSIDPVTGAVTLATDPNYESQPLYSFTVTATDEAGMSSEQAVIVNVTDMIGFAPTITSEDTATAVDENSGENQVVYTATSDDNSAIYSLADGSDSALGINASTGEVTLVGNPDYEAQSGYNFTVVATDAAGNSSSKEVSLDINDLDEAAPSITSGTVANVVNENSGTGQVIYTATSDDGVATYSLAVGSDSALSIDANSGEVTLNADPNYEAQSSYSFTVVATDSANNSSQQAVTLDISDADEIAPSITSGSVANLIEENSGAGQVIYTATAADGADVSSGVTFGFAEGSDSALSIDANTGAVTLNVDPNHEAQSSYSFTVVASDAVQQSEQAVTLDIGNLDEAAPTIVSRDQAVVYDNAGENPVIYTAIADDSADISDGVAYSLEDTTQYASTGGGSAESVVSIPGLSGSQQQLVYVSASTKSEDGTQEEVVITYNSDDSTTTG